MSNRQQAIVRRLAGLTHPERDVLLAMADHADPLGENVYPSKALLAYETDWSERQIQRIFQVLVGKRLIEIVSPAVPGAPGRPGRPTEYRLTLWNGSLKPMFRSTRFHSNRETTRPPIGPQQGANDGQNREQTIAEQGAPAVSPEPVLVLEPPVILEPSTNFIVPSGHGGPTTPDVLKDLWNDIVQKPRILQLSDSRKEKARARLREHPDYDWWTQVMQRIAASSFLRGAGNHGWRADFDWLVANDRNALKVLEGKYDSRMRDRAEAIAEEVGGGPEEVR